MTKKKTKKDDKKDDTTTSDSDTPDSPVDSDSNKPPAKSDPGFLGSIVASMGMEPTSTNQAIFASVLVIVFLLLLFVTVKVATSR